MFSKLKIVVCVLMIICFTSISKANKGNDSSFVPCKHIIKTRVLFPVIDLIFITKETNKMLGFSYERVITKNRTFNISIDISRLYFNTNFNQGYSQSNGVSLYPEYRFYPFNKKKMFPRGFYIGPSLALGAFSGWNEIYQNSSTYVNNTIVTTYTLAVHSEFKVVTIGAGAVLGWQYFLGKHKRFTMSHSLGFYANKNYIQYESPKISDAFRIYPKDELSYAPYIASYLGYTFIKPENKKTEDYWK